MGQRILLGECLPRQEYRAMYIHWGAGPVAMAADLRRQRTTVTSTTDLLVKVFATADADAVSYGYLDEIPGFDLELLYLIDANANGVTAYHHDWGPAGRERWELDSRFRLIPGDDELFEISDRGPEDLLLEGTIRCTCCGGINQVDFDTLPSHLGHDRDTRLRCHGCNSSQIIDPRFGSHVQRLA